jgi:hypothetical protein
MFGTKEEALAICNDVKELFAMLEKAAVSGCKFDREGNKTNGDNNYMFYQSEIEIGNNCIFTEVEGDKTSYLTFNTFNKLTTRHQDYCELNEKWLKNLMSKSNLLSGVSEKQRSQFFKIINDRLDKTIRKITGE